MSTEYELGRIASELKKIRLALERLSPPPPKDEKEESVYEKRSVWVL